MLLSIIHVVSALTALVLGVWAVREPNGTPRHRRIGMGYLIAWSGIAASGFALGADTPAISAFEVLTVVGVALVASAFGAVRWRRRLGPRWLRLHYVLMTASLAALVVTGVNQLLIQTLPAYPRWLFWVLMLSPFAVLPAWHARLDQRFAPELRRLRGA